MAVQGLERMESDLERVIEKDDESSQRSSPERDTADTKPMDLRTRLDHLVHSHKFMVGVIVLVVLDCVMVIAELLFDLEIVELGEDHHFVPHIFHYCSLAILSLFLIEVAMRAYVLRLDFFKHKLEVLDAVVVVVSWVLDIVFRNNEDAATGVGLLILLRLWRITRIINGIVLSVQKQADQKVEKERHLREASETELEKYAAYCSAVEARMEALEDLLRQNKVDFSSVASVAVERPKQRSDTDSSSGHKKGDDGGKKKSGKEAVEEAVEELNEIAGRVNDMEMERRSDEGGSDTKNIVI